MQKNVSSQLFTVLSLRFSPPVPRPPFLDAPEDFLALGFYYLARSSFHCESVFHITSFHITALISLSHNVTEHTWGGAVDYYAIILLWKGPPFFSLGVPPHTY